MKDKKFEVVAEVKVRLTCEDVDDIMCSVLDAIGYWCRKSSGAASATDSTQEFKETVKAAIIKGQTDTDLIDLRNFKDTVNAAVSDESGTDENWSWSVKTINKFRVKIGWGYTDSMGEKTPFSVRTEAGWVENPVVIGEMPNGQKVVAFVGDAPWDDYKTYEEAVAGVIHSMAQTARNIY